MKSIVLTRHGSASQAFEIKETSDAPPKSGEVAVKVEASGLNFADVLARLGMYQDAPPLPSVLGYEVVGKIAALGPGVTGFSLGQRVLAFTRFGGYASLVNVPVIAVVPLSDHWDAATATALATQYVTAYYAAEEMVRLHPGDHVLVQAAAGGVGTALVQLAKKAGCTVYGTAGSDDKLAYLREIGVDHPINYRTSDFAEVISRLSPKRPPDVIFDAIGGSSVKKGLKLLGSGGRIVCYGAAEMASEKKSTLRMLKTVAGFGFPHPIGLLMHSKSILGVNMLRIADDRPEVLNRCMKAVVDRAERGEFKLKLGAAFRPEEIGKAHDFLGSRKSVGKVAIRWP